MLIIYINETDNYPSYAPLFQYYLNLAQFHALFVGESGHKLENCAGSVSDSLCSLLLLVSHTKYTRVHKSQYESTETRSDF